MSNEVINKAQVKSAIKMHGLLGNVVAAVAMKVTGFDKINNIYSHISDYQGIEFADELINYLNVKCDYKEQELEYLPKEGPFIVVSNHPYGAIDGMIMLSILGKIRPDIKILTNFMLSYIPNLSDNFFPVNPFTDKPGLKSSLGGLKMAKEHLRCGGALGLFPSGEVSSNVNKEKVVKDIPWQISVVKLIRNSGVPVVPLFFGGQNSAIFHFLGKIHPMLRTVRLPHELSNKKNKTVALRVGKPIPVSELEDFTSLSDLGSYLWNRTYALEANIENQCPVVSIDEEGVSGDAVKWSKFIPFTNTGNGTSDVEISKPIESAILVNELNLRRDDMLFEVGQYACYLSSYSDIPNIINEIGIRREESFRAVGEGTGKEIDLDDYDHYYKHLFVWDKEQKCLVGAYRLGIISEILEQHGVNGIYSNTLFRYKSDFLPHLERTMELGRSFVSPAFQKEALPLMLLIKGLFYSVMKYPRVKYLIGPVSISSWYPPFYRSVMIYYLRKRHSENRFHGMVSPITPFKPDFNKVDVEYLLKNKMDSIEKFDKFIYKLSNSKYRLPTLLKKYLKINCRILDYNVDPSFNFCVDGLIMLDLSGGPKQDKGSFCKELPDKTQVYKRFDIG